MNQLVSEIQTLLTRYRSSYNNMILLVDFNISFSNINNFLVPVSRYWEKLKRGSYTPTSKRTPKSSPRLGLRTQHVSKAQNPYVFLIHLLSRLAEFQPPKFGLYNASLDIL